MSRSTSPWTSSGVNNTNGNRGDPTHHYNVDNAGMQPSRRTRRQADGSEVSDSTPLMDTETVSTRPPLARPETDEDGGMDDRETVNQPYPGVDDGFFTPGNPNRPNGNGNNVPEVEIIPNTPPVDGGRRSPFPQPGNNQPRDKTPERRPSFTPRFPENGPTYPNVPLTPEPNFPISPGFGFGFGSEVPESIPDVNVYQHKKTLAQGMMDLALFSANANQLRYVLESYERHPYYYPSVVFISISLLFQVAIGVGLIWNSRYNVKDDKEICLANKINNFTVIGIFIVTVVNVFISAFGVATPAPAAPLIGPRFGDFEDATLNITGT